MVSNWHIEATPKDRLISFGLARTVAIQGVLLVLNDLSTFEHLHVPVNTSMITRQRPSGSGTPLPHHHRRQMPVTRPTNLGAQLVNGRLLPESLPPVGQRSRGAVVPRH